MLLKTHILGDSSLNILPYRQTFALLWVYIDRTNVHEFFLSLGKCTDISKNQPFQPAFLVLLDNTNLFFVKDNHCIFAGITSAGRQKRSLEGEVTLTFRDLID